MSRWISIIANISGNGGVDGVVATEADVLAGVPFRAALPEDDVPRDDVLGSGAFEAEAAAGGVGGTVGAALGGVGGVSGLGEGWVVGDETERCEGCDERGEGGRGRRERVGYSWLQHRLTCPLGRQTRWTGCLRCGREDGK